MTHPTAGNIGGGGFMLVGLAAGRSTFIDFREKAPAAASHDMYLDAKGKLTRDSLVGWRAPGVPGSVRGFEYAHKKFGRKSWPELLDPSIKLAAEGYPLSYGNAQSLRPGIYGKWWSGSGYKLLSQFPDSKRIFLGHDAGDTFVQPELAATLKRIRDEGARDFYEGETAHRLAAVMKENGGLIPLEGLKDYNVVERKP